MFNRSDESFVQAVCWLRFHTTTRQIC